MPQKKKPPPLSGSDVAKLIVAIEKDDLPAMKALLTAGADPNAVDRRSTPALLIAASSDNLDVVEALLAAGADANIQDKLGLTALHFAESPEMTKLLLAKSADPNLADREGGTPLIAAVLQASLERTRVLLDAGADVNAESEEGWTALHFAVRLHSEELVELLLQRKANVNAATPEGLTPLSLALSYRKPVFARLLRAHGAKEKVKPKRTRKPKPEPKPNSAAQPDFTEAAQSPEFEAAIRALVKVCNSHSTPFAEIPGCMTFQVSPSKRIRLDQLQEEFLRRRCFVYCPYPLTFELQHHENTPTLRRVEQLNLLPTTDKYQIIAAMETCGSNCDGAFGSGTIIEWLKALEKKQPFVLLGIGNDFLAGWFTAPIRQPEALAKSMGEFCPALVLEGSVDELVHKLEQTHREYLSTGTEERPAHAQVLALWAGEYRAGKTVMCEKKSLR